MKSHTRRELRLWLVWLRRQWDRPDRHDWYLMQLACEVRRVLSKKPASIKVQDFKLRFGTEKTKSKPRTREEAAALSKAKWLGFVEIAGGKKVQGLPAKQPPG